ncbi:hypothetical protein RTG_02843 [Rhodotorula toruloides ATCC 204091]|uniref:Ataxin-10 homolog n=1 Tax=Rhodotorula toruloides TaxID=5286 RepID=A0A0K3C7T0_RHOTO|nr:hypothetical protein RTG_02843 [Rhodotorula toruloides ATCC 204091]KAK4335772.1 Copper transport protein 86 [Rhodotorula toruloides]PRQ77758.1 Spinocerebellar ataxia type 10 protein domain-domain containing protein [Rhodotorula toruloides]
MAEPPATPPAELVQQLESYAVLPGTPDELVQLLRPPRLGLRSTPSLRREYGGCTGFWPSLARVWQVEAGRLEQDEKESIPAVTALAAFVLSLCTQDEANQESAITHIELHLRRVLLTASSLANLENNEYTTMTRICCQTLANLVTANDGIAARYFSQRLKDEEEDKLLQRLLASPDHGTLQAILIFLLNSIHDNRERAMLLATTPAGAAILDRLMVLVGALFEGETAEGIAHGEFTSDIFQVSFTIIQQLISLEAFATAYEGHALMPGFSISPTLVTMLKFLDGHLSLPQHATTPSSLALVPFLIRQLISLGSSVMEQKERAMDAADAATFQGVVLVLHCLVSIGLALHSQEEGQRVDGGEEAESEMVKGVEAVVRLLRFSQTLMLPPTPRPAPPASVNGVDTSSSPPVAASASSSSPEACAAVAQLQRLAAQFLGIVSFLPPSGVADAMKARAKAAQDKVRECGGLELLLSMCQIDERNPTMREHALFAIRNLLRNNQTNQDFVDGMKPQYRVGANGELFDLPPALRTG